MTKPAVSIVMSCYNETKNLERGVLQEIEGFFKTQNYDWEVVITDDISTDSSLNLLQKFAKSHPNFHIYKLNQKGGKPGGIWNSIQHASYPIVLMTDIDQSTPISEITKLYPFFDQGYDVVIGSRGIGREGNSFLRKIGGPIFLTLRRLVLLRNIVDTQCGFKMLRLKTAKNLFPNLEVFKNMIQHPGWRVTAFDVELLFMAQKRGYKIKEVVVDWRNEDTSDTKGDSVKRYQKESVQMIQEIIRVKKNDLRGLYD
ncbi:glycosyltransferase [Candidatus Shapirobacteria bacterium]|nr:glycosyltransferase [Candidatus Shapirobacteria bacterium]